MRNEKFWFEMCSEEFFLKHTLTQSLLKSCKTKSKLYLKLLENPTESNKQKFTLYRNKFKALRI